MVDVVSGGLRLVLILRRLESLSFLLYLLAEFPQLDMRSEVPHWVNLPAVNARFLSSGSDTFTETRVTRRYNDAAALVRDVGNAAGKAFPIIGVKQLL
jgi:hypothetical protein